MLQIGAKCIENISSLPSSMNMTLQKKGLDKTDPKRHFA
jgi:hypothetical protein